MGGVCRRSHGRQKTEGRYAGGPLFLEASNLFNLPTGPTLGRRAAQVKESASSPQEVQDPLENRAPAQTQKPFG